MRLAELKAQTAALGLEVVQSGKREAKADYLTALRNHQLKQDYPSGLPYKEISPMLCFPYWDLSPREQREVWNSRDWLAQEKLNGCRVVLHFIKGVGVFAHSRTINKGDYRRTELSAQFLFHNFVPQFTAIVDSEVTAKDLVTAAALLRMRPSESRRLQLIRTPLLVNVFDIICWEGEDLRELRLRDRLAFLCRFRTKITSAGLMEHFFFPPMHHENKKEFYEFVGAHGGEGVVLKFEHSRYIDSTARDRNAWIKVKKSITFDAYCSGFERGRRDSKWRDKVACLHFSVTTESGERLIAKVSNIGWDFRKRISKYSSSTDQVEIEPSVLGCVATVSGVEFSAKALRLTHPTITSWKPLLCSSHCIYRDDELSSVWTRNSHQSPTRLLAVPSQQQPSYTRSSG